MYAVIRTQEAYCLVEVSTSMQIYWLLPYETNHQALHFFPLYDKFFF
jgi:hypothetical protein